MTFENILYEVQGPMALITIDRADKHNAISLATLADLQNAANLAASDEAVRVMKADLLGKNKYVTLQPILNTKHLTSVRLTR